MILRLHAIVFFWFWFFWSEGKVDGVFTFYFALCGSPD